MKNFNDFLNEDMGYTDFFGKKVTHEEALQKNIRDLIVHIITEERGISEKSFKLYDEVIEEVKDLCEKHPEIYQEAELFYREGKRLNYLAEKIYFEYFG